MDPEEMEAEPARKYKLLLLCRSMNAASRVSERERRIRQHPGRSMGQYPLKRRFAVSIVIKFCGEMIVSESEGHKYMGISHVVPSESRRTYVTRTEANITGLVRSTLMTGHGLASWTQLLRTVIVPDVVHSEDGTELELHIVGPDARHVQRGTGMPRGGSARESQAAVHLL
jgi:hypothetical protein